jgi:hypothetical protein
MPLITTLSTSIFPRAFILFMIASAAVAISSSAICGA